MLDLVPWLTPIEGDNPCGSDLAYDEEFAALVQRLKAQADLSDASTDAAQSRNAPTVDWANVLADADALRARGRDLRLLVIVARALVNQNGFDGLADGVTLIARMADAHWDTLHPTSPQRRISSLGMLQDRHGLLGDLRKRIVLNARSFGACTVLELERSELDVATATRSAGDKERAAAALAHEQLIAKVKAACAFVAEHFPEEIEALAAELRAATTAVQHLKQSVGGRLGPVFDIAELETCVSRTSAIIGSVARPAAPAAAEEADPLDAGPVSAPAPGRINSRDDVTTYLNRIIEFYDRTEPASPVPYLARRMLRMVPMDFLQLMEEFAPSGIKEFRSLAGIGEDGKPASRN